ncbi:MULTISPECIES: hypothetical protein [unclassified Saccharibacter]|uniref:cell division protein FtsL n=1 Tax=unclassified Saccharibacter TaxID=2648722 RepID=UPI00132B04C1|nr:MULTISPECIES: hypothetical protein [unclassified Saccharibacter]MXV35487.1 hypothetical protein [Saccharibacter sp. EH611]MXV58147.1 hypothetical protein [Saccharibacter sp. EH70]MXV65421.1 hypothetical protein [Saccharibacter sp. EH60]
MIRPATLFCALIAAGAGLFLYAKKHDTLVLDQHITQTVQETRRVQGQTAMLRTQWALLNQPDRLSTLSKRILPHLRMVEPAQFVRQEKLAERLPAISTKDVAATPTHTDVARPTLAALRPAPDMPVNAPTRPERHHRTAHADAVSAPSHSSSHAARGNSSLERKLALLNAEDQTSMPHRHHHSDHGATSDKDGHTHTSRASSSETLAETVAWHPQSTHRSSSSHRESSHTASSSDALPPPVPFSN